MKTEEFEEPEHISIHASAKEATDSQTKSTTAAKFQSTPPRRRRLKSPSFDTVSATDFNPRLREGGDENPERIIS